MTSVVIAISLILGAVILIQAAMNTYRNSKIYDLEIKINDLETDNSKLKLKCIGLSNSSYCNGCSINCDKKSNSNKGVKKRNGKSNRKNFKTKN